MKIENEKSGTDQDRILQYLNQRPAVFVTREEIARRADGKSRFLDDPRWPGHVLLELLELARVEGNDHDGYRVKASWTAPRTVRKRFISPQLRAILEKSGRLPGLVNG